MTEHETKDVREPTSSIEPIDERAPDVSSYRLLGLTALVEGSLLLVAGVLALLTGVHFWSGVELNARAVGAAIVLTLPMLIGLGISTRSAWAPFAQIREDVERVTPMFRDCTILDLLVISILAGVCEEALFRGVLQPSIAGIAGDIPALIIVAVLFGLVHPISIPYVVLTAVIGLYLGALQLWLGNLLVPMAIHGLYDFLALVYLVRIQRSDGGVEAEPND